MSELASSGEMKVSDYEDNDAVQELQIQQSKRQNKILDYNKSRPMSLVIKESDSRQIKKTRGGNSSIKSQDRARISFGKLN